MHSNPHTPQGVGLGEGLNGADLEGLLGGAGGLAGSTHSDEAIDGLLDGLVGQLLSKARRLYYTARHYTAHTKRHDTTLV